MTFMRKFMDMLNMENWKDSSSHNENNHIFPPLPLQNAHEHISRNIYAFWKQHPQIYHSANVPEAEIDEYKLYGKVLMLYAIGRGFPVMSSNEYPVYLYREGHITNPSKLHTELINEGYLVPASITQILTAHKVADLKILADSIGCSKSGTKAVLAHRIATSMDKVQLELLASQNNCYYLSQKGEQFLFDNNDYIKL